MKELAELNAIYQKMSAPDVDEAMIVTNADKKGNTPAYQAYKAGKKNVKTGKPMYKAADHMKESKKAKKDYDGDGKVESGKEEYFGSKDKAIKKAMGKEETEYNYVNSYLSELSKKTMGSYVKKAAKDVADRSFDHGESEKRQYEPDEETDREEKKIAKRVKGIGTAAKKMSEGTAPRMQKGAMAYDGPNKAASEAKDRVLAKTKAKRKGPKPTVTIDKPDKLVSIKIKESGIFSEEEISKLLWLEFDESIEENRQVAYEPEKHPDPDESDKPYRQRSRAARMRDPKRGINSPAFKKFMADRGM